MKLTRMRSSQRHSPKEINIELKQLPMRIDKNSRQIRNSEKMSRFFLFFSSASQDRKKKKKPEMHTIEEEIRA